MRKEEITIRVDAATAKLYREASEQDRRKLDLLLSSRLHDAFRSPRTLKEVIGDLSAKAQERGLTPEILESILCES